MGKIMKWTRRAFLGITGVAVGGAAIGYYAASRPWPNPLEKDLGEGENTLTPWIKIDTNNTLTIYVPRAEMGQGITTTLAALVAEELDVGLEDIVIEHGPAAGAYYNNGMMEEAPPYPFFDDSFMVEMQREAMVGLGYVLGLQITGGSSSTRDAYEKMRHAGAAAREALVQAAASQMGVAKDQLSCANKIITHKGSGKTVTYGEVADAAARAGVPDGIELRPASEWKLLGKSLPRTDMQAKVTGAPIFGVDVVLPDMVYGTVRMSPRFGAGIKSSNLDAAKAIKGVEKVFEIDTWHGKGFGVIANNSWTAFKAADAIEVEWEAGDYPADTEGLFKLLDDGLRRPEDGTALRDDGDVNAVLNQTAPDKLIKADYQVPYLAHTCMEPMNATAQLKDGKLTVWAPNQAPGVITMACGEALGMKPDAITVNTTYLGGGFGRRADTDYAVYAALVAAQADGRPVKVTWSREEDTTHDGYRPAAKGRFRAVLGEDGLPEALDMLIASAETSKQTLGRNAPFISLPPGPDSTLVQGSFDQPYNIANYRVSGVPANTRIPAGFWRSVGCSFNGFFHECFMDEIAEVAAMDPVDMRLKLMTPYPAAVKVVEKVAEMSNWGKGPGQSKAQGFAFTLSFGSWVGQVVEISDTPDGIVIDKVYIAADLGRVLDPSIVEAQLFSGAIYGLSSAISQEITISDGMVEQSNFHDFDAMRIGQCPEFEIELLENYTKMGGAGEIGTPPSVPALVNAVYKLTGKRIRTLPLNKQVVFA